MDLLSNSVGPFFYIKEVRTLESMNINSIDYIMDIEAILEYNKKLKDSFKELKTEQIKLNNIMKLLNNNLKGQVTMVGNHSAQGVTKFIRNRQGSVRNGNGGGLYNRLNNLSGQTFNIIKGSISRASSSQIFSKDGAKALSNSLGKIINNISSKVYKPNLNNLVSNKGGSTGGNGNDLKGFKSLISSPTVKTLSKVTTGIGLVSKAIGTLYKVGGQSYSQNIKLRNSLTQLGDGANYALGYANKLNNELGTPLNKSIENISNLSAQLKGSGGWSSGAAGLATQAYDLSTKLGLFYQNDPQEVFENMQRAIINGENSLLQYNVNVGDEVLAGWLQATKGINMYSVELSEGSKQAYRWMMIQEQLADISAYSGDLTSSTFAKQLEMMNKLEEMGIKLKALFMPLFSWLVEQANSFVDTLLEAVNSIRGAMGLDKIEWQTSNIAERDTDIVSALDKQNAAYRKQGELLKKNANQRLPFDEWISLDAMKQLNDELEDNMNTDNFDKLGSFTGTKVLDKDGNEVPNTKDLLNHGSSKDIAIRIKTSDKDGLLDLWDNFNLMQKGMYGTDLAVRLFQEGEIGKGLEALLMGSVGSFTGITAIKELSQGNYVAAISEGAQTALFWFGGWKGKIAFAVGELVELGLELIGMNGNAAGLLSTVSMIGVMIGGWKGAIIAASALLVPLAAKVGSVAGQFVNMKLNTSLGSEGTWGSIQSWDSRTAANMTYGKGTPEAEAEYYRLMYEKYGKGTNIPKYASGGIALSPHIAEIGHGPEAVIPLNGAQGLEFASNLANMITKSKDRDIYNDATANQTNLIVPVSTFIGDTNAYNELIRRIHDSLLDIERSEGGAFNGTY